MGCKIEDIARIINSLSSKKPHLYDEFIEQLKASKDYLPEKDYHLVKFFRIYKALLLFDFFSEKDENRAIEKIELAQKLLELDDPFASV